MVEDLIDRTTKQMEPEYKVTARSERLAGGVAIFFIITERDRQ
jgi:hypothetical protein